MPLKFSQLRNCLERSSPPVLLVSGDEPYQVMRACDMFRARAEKAGFADRKAFVAEPEFDWNEMALAKDNLSLFSARVFIDLRIPTGRPGTTGSKAIVNFVTRLHEDVRLLVRTPKLDRGILNSAWVKAIEKVGAVLRVWPTNETETRNWIRQALKYKGFSATEDIVSLIAQHAEWNLLAAMQEVEKLSLISENKALDLSAVSVALTNSSHYSLQDLTDAVAKKDTSRLIHVLHGLERDDVALPLLLWGLTEQARKITNAGRNKRSAGADGLARQVLVHQQGIGVCSEGKSAAPADLLKQCAWVDRVIKGRATGNPWHELLQLGIAAQLAM